MHIFWVLYTASRVTPFSCQLALGPELVSQYRLCCWGHSCVCLVVNMHTCDHCGVCMYGWALQGKCDTASYFLSHQQPARVLGASLRVYGDVVLFPVLGSQAGGGVVVPVSFWYGIWFN